MNAHRVVAAVAAAVVLLLVLVAGAVVALRFGSDGGADSVAGDHRPVRSLEDLRGTWTAVNDTTTPAPLVAPVALEVDGDRLVVRTGCNTATGTAGVADSRLVLPGGGLAVTEMACLDAGVMDQEAWVLEMVAAGPRLEVAGPYLALHWGAGEEYWLGLELDGSGEAG